MSNLAGEKGGDDPSVLLELSHDELDRPGRKVASRSRSATGRDQAPAKRGPHILLYGGFGIGNTGNDATLEVTLAGLRNRIPGAHFTVVATDPAVVKANFGVPAVAIRRDLGAAPRWLKRAYKLIGELGGWLRTRRLIRSADCLVIPGTGVFDDLFVTAAQHAYPMWTWCAAAKQAGVKVMFVSIGAGPVERAWSRRLFGRIAAMADYRSYRDETSKTFVRDVLGVDVSKDVVTPDLVFGLDVASPPLRTGGKRTIGIGVMDYHTWAGEKGSADDIYDAYMEKLSSFCTGLLRHGHALHILVGDVGDTPAADDLRNRLAKAAPEFSGQVTTARTPSLRDLYAEIGKTDAVVATRYHTVVGALMCGRPAISLGYAEKNRAVMADFGLGAYCQDIWDFDVTKLQTQLSELLGNLPAAGESLRHVSDRLREAVWRHLDEIATMMTGLGA